jgi:hypothetical protein
MLVMLEGCRRVPIRIGCFHEARSDLFQQFDACQGALERFSQVEPESLGRASVYLIGTFSSQLLVCLL